MPPGALRTGLGGEAAPLEVLPVWSWWEGTQELPALVSACVQSWKEVGSLDAAHGFDLRVLSPDTLRDWLPVEEIEAHEGLSQGCPEISRAFRSDFVRLALLSRHGGVWLDATIVATESFAWIKDALAEGVEFIAFRNPMNEVSACPARFPFIESSALVAATPGLPLIEAWKRSLWSLPRVGLTPAAVAEWRTSLALPDVHQGTHPVYHAVLSACLHALDRAGGIESFSGVWLRDGIHEHFLPCPRHLQGETWCAGDWAERGTWRGPLIKMTRETRRSMPADPMQVPCVASALRGTSHPEHALQTSRPEHALQWWLVLPLLLLLLLLGTLFFSATASGAATGE